MGGECAVLDVYSVYGVGSVAGGGIQFFPDSERFDGTCFGDRRPDLGG